MAQPTFLGVGSPKCGSTWLTSILESHPNIHLPASGAKELRYFDLHFDRGRRWYESQFGHADDDATQIGEFSPQYLYSTDAMHRISDFDSTDRFLIIVRNPVERAISEARHLARRTGFRGDLRALVDDVPDIIERGRYRNYIERWNEHFGIEASLILVLEAARQHPEETSRRLGEFLDVDPAGFSFAAAASAKNEAFQPRFPIVNAAANKLTRSLRQRGLHKLHGRLTSSPLRNLTRLGGRSPDPISPELRNHLHNELASEVEAMEQLLAHDLPQWRTS